MRESLPHVLAAVEVGLRHLEVVLSRVYEHKNVCRYVIDLQHRLDLPLEDLSARRSCFDHRTRPPMRRVSLMMHVDLG